jgi:hypothetical protein
LSYLLDKVQLKLKVQKIESTPYTRQGLLRFGGKIGLVPAARRKTSRDFLSGSTSSTQEGLVVAMVGKQRKYSMEQADIPNIGRLSIDQSSHQI